MPQLIHVNASTFSPFFTVHPAVTAAKLTAAPEKPPKADFLVATPRIRRAYLLNVKYRRTGLGYEL
jgi:hypothetical protein